MEAMIGAMLKKKCLESGWAELGSLSIPYIHVLVKPVSRVRRVIYYISHMVFILL